MSSANNAPEWVKITFVKSGGLMGLRGTPVTVHTNELCESDAEQLKSLVHGSGILGLPEGQHRTDGLCDAYQYNFTVETPAGTREYEYDCMSMPESLEPLYQYLQQLSAQS